MRRGALSVTGDLWLTLPSGEYRCSERTRCILAKMRYQRTPVGSGLFHRRLSSRAGYEAPESGVKYWPRGRCPWCSPRCMGVSAGTGGRNPRHMRQRRLQGIKIYGRSRLIAGQPPLPSSRLTLVAFASNEPLDQRSCFVVWVLQRWRLHEVGGGTDERAAQPSIQRQFAATYGVDHHSG